MKAGPCSESQYVHDVKKQAELDLIRRKTKLIDGEVWCEYSFVKNPACLSFNRRTVVKVAEKVEKDLVKDGPYSAYNGQIQSQLDRGQINEEFISKPILVCSKPIRV